MSGGSNSGQREVPEVRPEADACLGLGKTPRTSATEVKWKWERRDGE